MRSEKNCEPKFRFLFSNELFSDEAIELLKREASSRLKQEEKGLFFDNFVNWKRNDNEIAIFTLYAYADFEIPKKFNCLFNLKNPNEFVETNFLITQCIYEGWIPCNSIEHGHKHLCILEFKDKIPQLVNKLSITNSKFERSNDRFSLGICNSDDFLAIKNRIKHVDDLKVKYGSNWWNYDK